MRNGDDDLKALFAENAARFGDETFVARTMKEIRATGLRRLLVRRALYSLGIAALAGASPFLMRGADQVFREIESLLGIASRALETPVGTVLAILCSIVLVLLNRRRFLQRNW